MSRSGVITFKGTPLTLAGNEVKGGQPGPDFKLHYFEGGMKAITLADLKGKPTILSVVPSLDTAVCAMQTKKFNDQLGALGDKINARHRQPRPAVRDEPLLRRREHQEHARRQRLPGPQFRHQLGHAHRRAEDRVPGRVRARRRTAKWCMPSMSSEVTNEPDYDAALEALRASCK